MLSTGNIPLLKYIKSPFPPSPKMVLTNFVYTLKKLIMAYNLLCIGYILPGNLIEAIFLDRVY